MISDLEAPFPLPDAWNLPEEALVPPDLDDERLETWFERRDATYFAPALINGAIPIAHLGCAIWLRLVVAGPLAAQVWTDDRASDNGLSPASPAAFTDWYLAWLEESETALGGPVHCGGRRPLSRPLELNPRWRSCWEAHS